MKSLKAVPVDVCHLLKEGRATCGLSNLVGDDPKEEGNEFFGVLVPRRRVGAVDIVEGDLDILAPVGVFALSMEISVVA